MRRKKTNKQGERDFTHAPFRALKGYSPGAARSAGPASPTTSPAEETDAAALFFCSVGGVKPLEQPDEERDASQPTGPRVEAGNADCVRDREQFLRAMGALGANTFGGELPDDDPGGRGRRSPSSRLRQLKKGTIRIGQELDLHGFLREDAIGRLEHFIASAYAQGLQAVLVITGKGVNSPEGPVLQGAAADWLRTRGRSMVAEFHPAPRDKGGSGAFVVFLKRRRS
jgi:DNA-nicking Smr family endonuclease